MCPVNMRLTTVSASVPNEDTTLGQAKPVDNDKLTDELKGFESLYHLVVNWMCSDSCIQTIGLWQTSSIDCYIMEH